jgi:hypothetical protein
LIADRSDLAGTGSRGCSPRQNQTLLISTLNSGRLGGIILDMKVGILLFLLVVRLPVYADLPFKLPPNAKYTASEKSINGAKDVLKQYLVGDANALTNLFVEKPLCGPGLWNLLKDSAYFSKPPQAKSTVKIPLPNGKFQELPMALLQSDGEVASFRKALAVLFASQGKLTIRDPNRDEFMTFWAVYPFDEITDPLLVADGKDYSIICVFVKDKVFWIDEVRKMHLIK